jgi:hypothetical protein
VPQVEVSATVADWVRWAVNGAGGGWTRIVPRGPLSWVSSSQFSLQFGERISATRAAPVVLNAATTSRSWDPVPDGVTESQSAVVVSSQSHRTSDAIQYPSCGSPR